MRRVLLILCLLFVGYVYGEVWVNYTEPNVQLNTNLGEYVESFIFPYSLDNLSIQSMVVEVEAQDVDDTNAVYIKNYTGKYEYLGALDPNSNVVTFTIDNPLNYAYFYNGEFVIYLHFYSQKNREITVTFYNINGVSENITKSGASYNYIFEFPWSPSSTKKIEITIKYAYSIRSVDVVYADNYYLGALKAGSEKTTITTFNIDSKTAREILSDGIIKIKIDNNPNTDKITIDKITVKVYYTNKPISNKTAIVKTSITLGMSILALAVTLLTTLKRIR